MIYTLAAAANIAVLSRTSCCKHKRCLEFRQFLYCASRPQLMLFTALSATSSLRGSFQALQQQPTTPFPGQQNAFQPPSRKHLCQQTNNIERFILLIGRSLKKSLDRKRTKINKSHFADTRFQVNYHLSAFVSPANKMEWLMLLQDQILQGSLLYATLSLTRK